MSKPSSKETDEINSGPHYCVEFTEEPVRLIREYGESKLENPNMWVRGLGNFALEIADNLNRKNISPIGFITIAATLLDASTEGVELLSGGHKNYDVLIGLQPHEREILFEQIPAIANAGFTDNFTDELITLFSTIK